MVQLFTRDHGYMKVIARGAFRPKSPFRGVLETMNHIEVIAAYKDGRAFQTLTSASLINSYHRIREDLQYTAVAFATLELVQELLPVHEPVPAFFQYTTALLEKLDALNPANPQMYLWHYMLQLSETLGFGWALSHCGNCENEPAAFPLVLDMENGGCLCANCNSALSRNVVRLNRSQWEQLSGLATAVVADLERFNPEVLATIRPDLTDILLRHITYHTETRISLKSLKWYM